MGSAWQRKRLSLFLLLLLHVHPVFFAFWDLFQRGHRTCLISVLSLFYPPKVRWWLGVIICQAISTLSLILHHLCASIVIYRRSRYKELLTLIESFSIYLITL